MGLSQALSTAMSGLRATQAALALVSSNVANAETPGYVRKTVNQVAGMTGDYGSSVLLNGVNRQLDQYLQTQLRTETSGAAYADIRSTFLANLQNVYGNPAETGTIETAFNKLLTAFQGLSTSPDSQSARIGVVNAAQTMAQQLNATTQGIQSLRANAEMGINDSVITANNAMAQIASINNQLQNNGKTDAATASLLDQRDQYITQLSQLMDIRTVTNDLNQVTVFTNSGVQLVGTEAAQLSFNPQGTMTPNTLYNHRSDQEQCRHHHHQFPAWRQLRSGVDQLDPLGQDRRLSRTARQYAGEGAGADRPVRGVDVERAVGQDDGRHRRSRVGAAAGRLRSRSHGTAVRQRHSRQLQGQHHRRHAQSLDRARRRSERAAAEQYGDARSERRSARHRFFRRHGFGGFPAQRRARERAPICSFRIRPGSTLRVLDDGAPNRSDVLAASVTTTMSSLTSGNAAASVVHRQWRALYRRDHRQRLAADRSCRPHQRQYSRCSAIPRAPSYFRPAR